MTLIGIEPNVAMFIPPERYAPSACTGHVPFASWLTAIAWPYVLVELGAHLGRSYAAFCQTVQTEQLPTKCYAVNTWRRDAHSGTYGEDVYQDLADFNARRFAGFSQLMCTSFDEAASSFLDGSVGLLHIDDLHTYEAVRQDFETWLSQLSARATAAVRGNGFGVGRYWDERASAYLHFEFDHASGWGVLQVGNDIHMGLTQLFELDQDAEGVRRVKEIFSTLGAAVVQRHVLEGACPTGSRAGGRVLCCRPRRCLR